MMNCKKSTKILLAAAVCLAALLRFVGLSISTFLPAPVEAAVPSQPERLLAPRPERLLRELEAGVVFDFDSEELCIPIPDELPEGWAWSIHPAGRAAMGDGGRSVHWFEAESAANSWQPGKTYAAPLGGELLSYDVDAALLNGEGEVLTETALSWSAKPGVLQPASGSFLKEDASVIGGADGPTGISVDSSGVSVIGGADGPTAIFVAPLFTPPLAELTVVAPFDEGPGHKGVDYRAEPGEAVFAAAEGTVSEAGWDGAYGYRVILDHGDGFQTLYAHCSALHVKAGDTVTAGQRIAAAGAVGNATGPCLHFKVRLNGEAFAAPLFCTDGGSWRRSRYPT